MEVRGEKINISSDPSKEMAGLKKMKMMTPESQDSRVWEFSREALKIRRGPLGLCVGTYGRVGTYGPVATPLQQPTRPDYRLF